jgi:hypothetical protein
MASAVAAHNRAFGEDVVACSNSDLDEAELVLGNGPALVLVGKAMKMPPSKAPKIIKHMSTKPTHARR